MLPSRALFPAMRECLLSINCSIPVPVVMSQFDIVRRRSSASFPARTEYSFELASVSVDV